MAGAEVPSGHPMQGLPTDMQVEILTYLAPRDLASLASCSSACAGMTNEERVWRSLYMTDFSSIGNPTVTAMVQSFMPVSATAPRLPSGAAAGAGSPPAPSLSASVDALRGVQRGRYWEPNPLPHELNAKGEYQAACRRLQCEVRRNQAAQRLRGDLAGGRATGRWVRCGLDCCNIVCAQSCVFPLVLTSLVLGTGQLDGSWDLSWWVILAPLLLLPFLLGGAFLLSLWVESRSLEDVGEAVSPWYLQGPTSRANMCGALAFEAQRILTLNDTAGERQRTQQVIGSTVVGCLWCCFLLQVVLLGLKLSVGWEGMPWGVTFIPTFLLCLVVCLAPLSVAGEYDMEEATAAGVVCFCCLSLPIGLTALLLAVKFDSGDDGISVAGALVPAFISLAVLSCAACALLALLVNEGELGGNRAAQWAATTACCVFISLVLAPLVFLAEMAAVGAGDVRAVGVTYFDPVPGVANITVNGTSGVPTDDGAPGGVPFLAAVTVQEASEGDVSWWALATPLLFSTLILSLIACGASYGMWLRQRMVNPLYYRPTNDKLPEEVWEYV